MPEISIIVRSKNEEKWISACLEAIFSQTFNDFEVILVDNQSTDKTIEKALQYDVTLVEYTGKFYPGKAINLGIEASSGKYIAIISAHCIPVDEYWLENLYRNLSDESLAGVYGRQQPLPFTSDMDKRDLINVFGLDRKIQVKDTFFHNANSMIPRSVWEKFPFNNETLHIEDRIWGKEVLAAGYKLAYEPEASVYHYHGINQGRNIQRAQRIARILEDLDEKQTFCKVTGLKILAIIPSRGPVKQLGDSPLITRTIEAAKRSNHVNKIIISSDNQDTLAIGKEMGVEGVLRPERLSMEYATLSQVYQFTLDHISKSGFVPDVVVLLEEIYPFRPNGYIDSLVEGLLQGNYETVIPVCPEYGFIWREEGDSLTRVDQGLIPSKLKDPLYRGLPGLGYATHPSALSNDNKFGDKVGLLKVEDYFSRIAIRNATDLKMASAMEADWLEFLKNDTEKRPVHCAAG